MKNNPAINKITLRDIFAAIALHGQMEMASTLEPGDIEFALARNPRAFAPKTLAKDAYKYADAMLVARVAKED